MDMLRARRLKALTENEDEAREFRNRMGREMDRPMTTDEGRELANILTQSLQTIREML